jgi:arsenate reductase
VKKARNWLTEQKVDYQFHDFRQQGIEREVVAAWISQLGWETVLNKRSTSWKQLDEASRAAMDADSAIDHIVANPTLVKRPLIDRDGHFSVGFNSSDYQNYF